MSSSKAYNVAGNHILDGAQVGSLARVFGKAKVYDQAVVGGKMKIGGTAKIMGGTWEGGVEITEGVWHDPEDWSTNVLF